MIQETLNYNEIITLLIALLALLVTYTVFKSNERPQIIVYIEANTFKETFISLVVENVGRGRAENIKFTSDRAIPYNSFGLEKLNSPKQEFQHGVFHHGIKIFNPGQRLFYDWGQFGGLTDALENRELKITATYEFKHPLNPFKSRIQDISIININELEGLPTIQGHANPILMEMAISLKSISEKMK
ncbi:hypothetical protein [Acinetobacter sp. KS-LM10]|uniref:hypothetical protein n=1 Tax=Acinetobacter sp. KS-LM10 TaxID=3120518 RepID=UPI0030CC8C0A